MDRQCPYCGATFTPRATGGVPQRFCQRACKEAYHRFKLLPDDVVFIPARILAQYKQPRPKSA